jgi:hypothetical protein
LLRFLRFAICLTLTFLRGIFSFLPIAVLFPLRSVVV